MEPLQLGNKKALFLKNIQNNTKRKKVIESLRKIPSVTLWEKQNNTTITYEVIDKIKENPYLIRGLPEGRNNGGRVNIFQEYFFFLTNLNDIKLCFLVEKKKPIDNSKIYQVRYRFKEELFKNTLMTGYLVLTANNKVPERVEITSYFSDIFPDMKREISTATTQPKKQWIFLLNDLWLYLNKDVSLILSQRIVRLQEILNKKWNPDPKTDNFHFKIQNYYNYANIFDFLKHQRKEFPYQINDSKVIFVSSKGFPSENIYLINLKNKLPKKNIKDISFKNGEWKINQSKHHVDIKQKSKKEFILKKSEYPDVYWLYIDNKKIDKPALIQTDIESKTIKKLFENKTEIKIYCKWNNKFEKWKPII